MQHHEQVHLLGDAVTQLLHFSLETLHTWCPSKEGGRWLSVKNLLVVGRSSDARSSMDPLRLSMDAL